MLCLAIVQAWRARELSTEYQESEYIFKALFVIFLVVFIGLPVLVIARDNPDASVFLASAVIAVSSCAIVSLIFVPKIRYVRKAERSDASGDKVKISGIGESVMNNGSSGNASSPFKNSTNSTDSDDYGDRIITTKTKRQLVEENAELRRRIHVLEKERFDPKSLETSDSSPNESAHIEEATADEGPGSDEDKNL